ncbi:hypothetical protein GM160_01360 [Guyparkeria halophila]|uniref:Uncharacterized protein n=1 Tax=Guyparkeria halophila TaxID=47960 RepID=A0A6I6D1A4_9GAMM|nr:hypothetical protein [Guyparkeria halophila]QGT77643.1 hypothetical protein GM160_01360 [Guyparkeria halophila]
MSQREHMQRLVELKRALEKDMGITVDMSRYGVEQRLRRLARASEDPAVKALADLLDQPAAAAEPDDSLEPGPRIRGYYRGRPIYDD